METISNRSGSSLANPTNLPDFIIIGAQKAGTSALRYNLNKHPDIYMATIEQGGSNEPNFFTRPKNWEKGLSWYTDLFQHPDKIQGEKSPDILFNNQAIIRIAQTVPNAKLIVLLRDPVTRAYSAWNHNNQIIDISQNWGWRAESFETALSLAEKQVAPFKQLINKGIYIAHINNLLQYFPREQLFFGIAERFKQHPNEQLNKVLSFLGAANMELKPEIRHDRKYTEPMNSETKIHLKNLFKPINEQLYAFLGEEISEWQTT